MSKAYTHVELCMAACHDLSVLDTNQDIHVQRACQIFRVSPDKVTPVMRRHAKNRAFRDCYGQHPWLCGKTDTPPVAAQGHGNFLAQAESVSATQHLFVKHPWVSMNVTRTPGLGSFVLTGEEAAKVTQDFVKRPWMLDFP